MKTQSAAVLLALLLAAADLSAQEKFSLFDRAVAQGGSTVATEGSVLMVGAAGSIFGKVWTGTSLNKIALIDASGLLGPMNVGDARIAFDPSRAHWTFQITDTTTTDNKAALSINKGCWSGFCLDLRLGDSGDENSGDFILGRAYTYADYGALVISRYQAYFPFNGNPGAFPVSFRADTNEGIVMIGAKSDFANDGCFNVGSGFCVEDAGGTPKVRFLANRTHMVLAGLGYRFPTTHPNAVGKVLTTVAGGTGCTTPASDCQLDWGTPSSGTVTSVGLAMPEAFFDIANSPVTGSGTLTVTLDVQDANKLFAGPASGAAATPVFRALVNDDVPDHSGSKITSGTVPAARLGLMTGDAGSGGTSGAVPAPATGDATKFFRGDGTYATPSGSDPTSAQGDLYVRDGTGPTALAIGTNTYVLTVDTAEAKKMKWAPGSASTPAQTFWIMADPNYTTGAGYERPSFPTSGGPGLVQLAAQRTWTETIADAKTNTPAGWTWVNTEKLSSADANTTTANALRMVGDSTACDFQASTRTCPLLYKTYYPMLSPNSGQLFVARVAIKAASASIWAGLVIWDDDGGTKTSRILINNTSGSACQVYADVLGSSATATATTAECGQGIWFVVQRMGPELALFYSKANQATPPTDFSYLQFGATGLAFHMRGARVGFVVGGSSAVATKPADVLYFDDTMFPAPVSLAACGSGVTCTHSSTGFDSSSPVLTLVSGFDLGAAGSTVADADVQAALTEITNPRNTDTAAWTFSVTRGSSAPVSCDSYAAAASVTVGGSGRYLSVCAKAASTGRILAGSLDVSRFRIPFKM